MQHTAGTAARVIRNGTTGPLQRRLHTLPSGRLLRIARRAFDRSLVAHGTSQDRLTQVVTLALFLLASRTQGFVAP